MASNAPAIKIVLLPEFSGALYVFRSGQPRDEQKYCIRISSDRLLVTRYEFYLGDNSKSEMSIGEAYLNPLLKDANDIQIWGRSYVQVNADGPTGKWLMSQGYDNEEFTMFFVGTASEALNFFNNSSDIMNTHLQTTKQK